MVNYPKLEAMRLNEWLSAYAESHQNKTNKAIHWVCVPAITFSLLALCSLVTIPLPQSIIGPTLEVNLGHILILLAFGFYLRLSRPLAFAMLLFGWACLSLSKILPLLGIATWISALTLFGLAWIGQFYGHKIEGKKPSFLKDIQFLLIGPIWILADLFNRLGIKY